MPNCLIVDDSAVIRRLVRRIFEDIGYDCIEAEDGKQALDSVERAMPDLIMLDWNMPVMNGLEFLTRVRALKNGSFPKIVFCTTENTMDAIMTGLQAGANEYIMKPFDKDVVIDKLNIIGASIENARNLDVSSWGS